MVGSPFGVHRHRRGRTDQRRWVTFAKGGPSTPFYSELGNVVNWATTVTNLRPSSAPIAKVTAGAIIGALSCITRTFTSARGSLGLARKRILSPSLAGGCIFSVRGYAVFAPTDQLLPLVGCLPPTLSTICLSRSWAGLAFRSLWLGPFKAPHSRPLGLQR